MPHQERVKLEGRVTDIFRHRFVIELLEGEKVLADLGPQGARTFRLEKGTDVVVEGEQKPSEVKVERIARKGEKPLEIDHKKKHAHGPAHHGDADPDLAKRAVAQAGFEPIGEPRRKPKHFEVLGRTDDRFVECHVEFDGRIRKERPVEPWDDKWSSEVKRAA